MIIDTRQHTGQLDRFHYDWLGSDKPALFRDFMPDDVTSQMRTTGVDACVMVEASNSWAEIPWLLDLAEQHDHIGDWPVCTCHGASYATAADAFNTLIAPVNNDDRTAIQHRIAARVYRL